MAAPCCGSRWSTCCCWLSKLSVSRTNVLWYSVLKEAVGGANVAQVYCGTLQWNVWDTEPMWVTWVGGAWTSRSPISSTRPARSSSSHLIYSGENTPRLSDTPNGRVQTVGQIERRSPERTDGWGQTVRQTSPDCQNQGTKNEKRFIRNKIDLDQNNNENVDGWWRRSTSCSTVSRRCVTPSCFTFGTDPDSMKDKSESECFQMQFHLGLIKQTFFM